MKAFIDGRLGYSSAVGIVMATMMMIFGAIYLRYIAAREFKEVL
jgi:multiple sugar transport system permease protein